jgi:hypothetical protein
MKTQTQSVLEMDLRQALASCTGSTKLYRHWLRLLRYTEGVDYLVEQAKAFWLIDAIASYQPQLREDPMLAEFQVWDLLRPGQEVIPWIEVEGNAAVLVCWPDTPTEEAPPAVRQDIPLTDFPLTDIRLYVSSGTLYLPSEH